MSHPCTPFQLAAALAAALVMLPARGADEPAPTPPATAPATPAERAPLPSRSDSQAAGLQRQLPADQFVALTAGGEDVVALWQPANVGEPKGLIILLPGQGESADWPSGIGPLRRGLPDHGWQTLSLSLPDSATLLPSAPLNTDAAAQAAPATAADTSDALKEDGAGALAQQSPPVEAGALPEATTATGSAPGAEETDTAPTEPPNMPSEAERIDKRIDAALAFARSKQPAGIVMIGQGTGGYWAARYLQQQAPAGVKGVLVIQPERPQGQDEPLAQLLPSVKGVVGDFFYDAGPGEQAAARERLNASRRTRHPAYRQLELPDAVDRDTRQAQLLRRARGWLDRLP